MHITPVGQPRYPGVDMSDVSFSDISLPAEPAEADHTERDVLLTLALVIAAEVGTLVWFLL
jgi:hypothetical protein